MKLYIKMLIPQRTLLPLILSLIIGGSCWAQQSPRQLELLEEGWEFYKGSIEEGMDTTALDWKAVSVPHTWNADDMQKGEEDFYEGDSWYRRSISVKPSQKGKRLFLRFRGVGQVADVYLNDRHLGQHRGGYSPFSFEITDAVRFDTTNTLMVRANNQHRPDVIPVNHELFGVYGGIYRPVELITTNKMNITVLDYASSGVYISQKDVSEHSANLEVKVKLENDWDSIRDVKLRILIKDAEGQTVLRRTRPLQLLPQGLTIQNESMQLQNPHLWNGREDPYLYSVVTQLIADNKVVDQVTEPLGVRSFEIKPGKGFFLNGEPYRLYGVARHQDWWGKGSALSPEDHQEDIQMIYDMGATSIRFAHYQQSRDVYAHSDSLGLIVWAEIPFVRSSSGQEEANARQQLRELIRQNYNHPSIYVWGLHNEVYANTKSGHAARLTRELNNLAKVEDPYRYTGSVNGRGRMKDPMNEMADIQAMNRYYGWYYGEISDMEKWIAGLAKKYPDHKVVLGEYGAGGNIDQQQEDLQRPDNVIDGPFFPEGYQTKMHIQQWSIIEDQDYLVASYVWNMFDFSVPLWTRGGINKRNLKGLVTFDRERKKDAFFWYKANWSPNPTLHIAGRRLKKRSEQLQKIQVFANVNDVQLSLNGNILGAPVKGTTDNHFIWERVELQAGKNVLRATGQRNGQTYMDTIELVGNF